MEKTINKGLNLKFIQTSKFKMVNMQLSFTFNLEYEDIAAYNLLLNLMITRNRLYKDMSSFNLYLENNY